MKCYIYVRENFIRILCGVWLLKLLIKWNEIWWLELVQIVWDIATKIEFSILRYPVERLSFTSLIFLVFEMFFDTAAEVGAVLAIIS